MRIMPTLRGFDVLLKRSTTDASAKARRICSTHRLKARRTNC
jgi:hypothetical protein